MLYRNEEKIKLSERERFALARQIIRLGMRRQIVKAERAYQAGKLSANERDDLIAAYRTVQSL